MSDEPENAVQALAAAMARAEHREVELACEEALAGGKYGVLITRGRDGRIVAQVDPSVPYGTIHDRRLSVLM